MNGSPTSGPLWRDGYVTGHVSGYHRGWWRGFLLGVAAMAGVQALVIFAL